MNIHAREFIPLSFFTHHLSMDETLYALYKLPRNKREQAIQRLHPNIQSFIRLYIFKTLYEHINTYTEYNNDTIYIHYTTPYEYLGVNENALLLCANDYLMLSRNQKKKALKILPYSWRKTIQFYTEN